MSIATEPAIELDVNVSARHVKRGAAGSCIECPIALAIIDALFDRNLPQWNDVIVAVHPRHVTYRADADRFYRGSLPDAAQQFIESYDDATDPGPGPFSFHLILEPVP